MIPLALLTTGLAGLWIGTTLAVRGAVMVCDRYGLSQGFVGLAVLAVGTDLPELVVALDGSIQQLQGVDASGVIVGAAFGSVVAQGSLVLGVAGLFGYLPVAPRMVRRDGLTLLLAVGLAAMMAGDGRVGRTEGTVMLLAYAMYFVALVQSERRGARPSGTPLPAGPFSAPVSIAAGLSVVTLSAHLVVRGGIDFATQLGVSQALLAVLIVGVGTSLPELALSIRAATEKRPGLSVGNVIGSNIFDLLVPVGLGAAIFPLGVERNTLVYDLPTVALFSVVLLGFLVRRRGLQRGEAAVLLVLYMGYASLRVLTG